MYIPKAHEELSDQVMHDLIGTHPLATLITRSDDGLTVNHIPFLLDGTVGPHGTLRGHVARANPVWRELAHDCVVVFQGPQAYVSPNWYPSKHQTGKAVPTWNYAVVHAHGRMRVNEDRDWLRQMVSDLTDEHEQHQSIPWQVSDAPKDYLDQMLSMIVGIELPIARLVGKWKVSQNRQPADRLGVVAGLSSQADKAESIAMARLVRKAIDDEQN